MGPIPKLSLDLRILKQNLHSLTGIDVNAIDMYGNTPTDDATRGNQKVAKALLEVAGGVSANDPAMKTKVEKNKQRVLESNNRKLIQRAKGVVRTSPEHACVKALEACGTCVFFTIDIIIQSL